MRDALAPSTAKKYASAKRAFDRFIALYPAYRRSRYSPFVMSLWVTHLSHEVGVTAQTISGYLAGVRAYCIDHGRPIVSAAHPVVKKALEGAARRDVRRPDPVVHIRWPVTFGALEVMSLLLDDTHSDRLWAAAAWVAVAGIFRTGEVGVKSVRLTAEDRRRMIRVQDVTVDWTLRRFTLRLRRSKTDQRGAGAECGVTEPRAFAALTKYIAGSEAALHSTGPIFQHADGTPMTAKWLTSRTRELAHRAGLWKSGFVGLSFRRGGATEAARAKPEVAAHMADIKRRARWSSKSDRMVMRYVAEHLLSSEQPVQPDSE